MNPNERVMRVTDIKTNVTQRSNKHINVITFEGPNKVPYVAEEPVDQANFTHFKMGKVQSFRISFPANMPGKKDWIEYIGDAEMNVPEDSLAIAIAAFGHVSKSEFGLDDTQLLMRTIEVGTLIKNAAQML